MSHYCDNDYGYKPARDSMRHFLYFAAGLLCVAIIVVAAYFIEAGPAARAAGFSFMSVAWLLVLGMETKRLFDPQLKSLIAEKAYSESNDLGSARAGNIFLLTLWAIFACFSFSDLISERAYIEPWFFLMPSSLLFLFGARFTKERKEQADFDAKWGIERDMPNAPPVAPHRHCPHGERRAGRADRFRPDRGHYRMTFLVVHTIKTFPQSAALLASLSQPGGPDDSFFRWRVSSWV